MVDPKTAERVRDAYIKPIRTVLVVDDDFHNYDADKQGKDPARAHALWRACRNTGRLCDVDDGAALVQGQAPDYMFTSDMVILDYHLLGEDPRWALQYLCLLASADHASIVVVYTKDDKLLEVRRAIAAHLRGVLAKDKWFPSLEVQEHWDRVETKIKHRPTGELFDAYVVGNSRTSRTDKGLLDELKALGVPDHLKAAVAEVFYESIVLAELGGQLRERATIAPQMGGGAADTPPWVYASNLFVACVQKTADNQKDGSLVFGALENALCDWNPDFMLSAVAFARGEFARGGFAEERTALGNQHLKSGWLFHAWSGSADEQPTRLRALFERLIASYSKGVMDRVIEFGGKHVPPFEKPDNAPESLRAAIKEFCGDKKELENSVIHALNEFLVIEDVPAHVETGTIFARASDGAEPAEVYVCVTPACDLVPRKPKKAESWEHKIHPARAVIVMRAKMIDAGRDHLLKAEEGRSIFLQVAGKSKAILLVGDKPPVPTLEWLFLEDMGKITDHKLRAMEVGRPEAQAAPQGAGEAAAQNPAAPPPQNELTSPLTFMPTEMVALGQIRAIYASRILQYAGQHLARIGVDFVSYPEDSKSAKVQKK